MRARGWGDSTKRAFSLCGYDAMARACGVELFDTKGGPFETLAPQGIRMEISRRALELGFLISLPVLKGHCQTRMTCALKNMKGRLSDRSKRDFHTLGLDRPIAALSSALCADLVLVDGLCGDLDFEEGGQPRPGRADAAGTGLPPSSRKVRALGRLREKIRVGQGFAGRRTDGAGVGKCCAGCARHVGGCPPDALSILRFLGEL